MACLPGSWVACPQLPRSRPISLTGTRMRAPPAASTPSEAGPARPRTGRSRRGPRRRRRAARPGPRGIPGAPADRAAAAIERPSPPGRARQPAADRAGPRARRSRQRHRPHLRPGERADRHPPGGQPRRWKYGPRASTAAGRGDPSDLRAVLADVAARRPDGADRRRWSSR